jgi:nitroimidazol reductase NimA-like FMN-containing flavoprotein (pyridoxamine 5'-phosphate oxidase superfamily)
MSTTDASPMATISRFEILDDDECLRLLADEPVGRIALTSAALPVVLPVNFVAVDHTIVFASDPGLKLQAARAGQVACLEIDGYDVLDHSGWSVLATGRLSEITDAAKLRTARSLPLSPWALSAPEHFVELSIELLSGRRIRRP